MWGIQPVVPGIFAAAVAYLWLNELRLGKYHSAVAPIGYGLTLLFVQIEATSRFGHTMAMMLGSRAAATDWPWFGETLAAAALFVSVWVMVRRAGWALAEKRAVLALAAAAAIGAVSLQAPGVAAGLMITLLGFANANRVLTALGIMALLGYVSTYYYLLDATLLVKSGVLLATGLVLLAVRWMVLNVVMPREGQDA